MTSCVGSARHLGRFPRPRGERWVMVGQDGGQSIDLGGRTLFVFSDTLLLTTAGDEQLFLANCAALAPPGDLRQALDALDYVCDEDGFPLEIVPATEEERTAKLRFWPTHGVRTDDGVLLFYLGIESLDDADVWAFRNVGVGIARVDPDTGDCQRVRRDGDWRLWPPRSDDFHFGTQVLVEDGHAYVYGSTRSGLRISGLVARAPLAGLAAPASYEVVGELGPCGSDYSVSFNPYLEQYLLIYVDSFSKELAVRVADEAAGPYSEPEIVGRLPHSPSSNLIYLAFEHPTYAREDGRRVLVSYCEPRFTMSSLLEVCFR